MEVNAHPSSDAASRDKARQRHDAWVVWLTLMLLLAIGYGGYQAWPHLVAWSAANGWWAQLHRPVGRYQIQIDPEGHIWRIDTMTGEICRISSAREASLVACPEPSASARFTEMQRKAEQLGEALGYDPAEVRELFARDPVRVLDFLDARAAEREKSGNRGRKE